MESSRKQSFICFNCLKSFPNLQFRAFDQNFCSQECVTTGMEINELFDYGFNNKEKWVALPITLHKEIEKKELNKKICNSLVEDIVEKSINYEKFTNTISFSSLNLLLLDSPAPVPLFETTFVKIPSFHNQSLNKDENNFYEIPITPLGYNKKKSKNNKYKFLREGCNFDDILSQFDLSSICFPSPIPLNLSGIKKDHELEELIF